MYTTISRKCSNNIASMVLRNRNCHILLFSFVLLISQVIAEDAYPASEFSPHVTATCKGGTMNIKVKFEGQYTGTVHARDYRTQPCMAFGNGSASVVFSVNLLAKQGASDYCGVLVSNVSGSNRTEERSIQLAVRMHKTLELADDKFYVITCGKSDFSRDNNAHTVLQFIENDRRVSETVYGHKYIIRAEVTKLNGTSNIRVANCFAFDKKNTKILLNDERGCPYDPTIMTRFIASPDGRSAEATIQSMFKFPEGSELHLQCDVITCYGKCVEDDDCSQIALAGFTKGNIEGKKPASNEEGTNIAGTTVFVLDPAKAHLMSECSEGGIRPAWLLWLTITLGVLFLIMLLMNIFLCTAMSCSCANTEIIEKEPSIIEEYDPYRSWHGSQYGSRYSLHGRDAHKGYTSGGSTIHSNRSDRY